MSVKKIAKQVGTSPATVSRVLNNPEYKCQEPGLRDRIWKAAMEQKYVPNEAARNLKRGHSPEGAQIYYLHVLMTRMDTSLSDPFFSELLRVVESEIHKNLCILSRVWYLSVFSDDQKCRKENLDSLIGDMCRETEGKNDGLIIIGKCNQRALKKLAAQYRSVVSINRNSTNYEVDEVLCDGEKIASMAVEYLVSLGHRDIAYVGECRNEARYRGYLDTLKLHKIAFKQDYVFESRQTEADGFACMEQIVCSELRPTGIYCANDITAVGVLKCLSRYKGLYYMPSVISADDIEQAQNTSPMLTTVRLPKDEMGKFALYLLLDRLRGGHKGVVRMEMEGKLMIRNSCSAVDQSVWSDYCI
ncbi:MAG: LacI family transcriptional regulator [Lachnospiraceae bacterium]|nr:LacI family transcriptional regulator [Lachnospiraceae bacterium]